MKIGILTFHCAHNYGAVLQCYALQEYLKSFGHEVYVIDYRPQYLKYGLFVWYKWFSFNPLKCLKKILWQIHTFSIQRNRSIKFENFIHNKINLRELNLRSCNHDIDCFVFGSDQIWRKNREVFDPVYFADFNAAKNRKLISYAASMGINSLSDNEKKQISKWLKRFSIITVREKYLKELLQPLTDKKIYNVIDPTFLLQPQDWDEIAINPSLNKPYVLIYQVIYNQSVYNIAQKAATEIGASIIEIVSNVKETINSHQTVQTASPEEFLGWFRNAKFVVTTSFHGTAFSLIFNRPFVSIKQNRLSDLRIESMLSQIQLSNRFVKGFDSEWKPTFLESPQPNLKSLTDYSKGILLNFFQNV